MTHPHLIALLLTLGTAALVAGLIEFAMLFPKIAGNMAVILVFLALLIAAYAEWSFWLTQIK